MKLEIGCGNHPEPGFTHLDIQPLPHIEIVADAREIPLEDNTVDEIRAIHVLEHFWWHEAEKVLVEWHRVLKPEGKMRISLPNLDYVIGAYIDESNRWQKELHRPADEMPHNTGYDKFRYLMHLLYGTGTKWNAHHACYSFDALSNILSRIGFKDIYNNPGCDPKWLDVWSTKE